ncbi:hypothetical protein E8E12_010962 [Didymella heteroderae]|uniref:Uncharacterized protein n=1 Tax=Didymella heteroderae TaxID=1769908 RepID=A0A9P4WXK4_9PLEO|nr:hypothetical protein E8E12_010962 [Didymella heteroderae]
MTRPVLPHGRLRLARLTDLPRIGFVAAAGFFHSTFFSYARPFYSQYPNDTVASYRAEYWKGILDPTKVVLVALDDYKENEVDFVYDALKEIYSERWSEHFLDENGKIIVGVISVSLEMDLIRYGEFNPEGRDAIQSCEDPEDRGRDVYPEALKMVEEALNEPAKKYAYPRAGKHRFIQSEDVGLYSGARPSLVQSYLPKSARLGVA